jgi:16S rRNA processing protein RimM
LAEPEGGIENPAAEEFEVEGGAAGRPGEVRLALRGITDRDAAEGLKGRLITSDPEHLPPLPEGEFYWYELIGCRVQAAGGRSIGTVKEIWETGAHDVLVVEREDGRSCLVPTARALMKEVDIEAGRIVVEDLPGLFDPIREDVE